MWYYTLIRISPKDIRTLHSMYLIVGGVWQVRYTGHMDKTLHERQLYLRNDCREGHANIVSISIMQIIRFAAPLSSEF